MQVARWGNSLAVRLPAAVVEALNLKEGDDIEIRIVGDKAWNIDRDRRRQQALEDIRALRKPLPSGWTFDREDAGRR